MTKKKVTRGWLIKDKHGVLWGKNGRFYAQPYKLKRDSKRNKIWEDKIVKVRIEVEE